MKGREGKKWGKKDTEKRREQGWKYIQKYEGKKRVMKVMGKEV